MRQWYYMQGPNRVGPVPDPKLRELLGAGAIDASTQVWTEGMVEWKPLSAVMRRSASEARPAAPAANSVAAPATGVGAPMPSGTMQETALIDPTEGIAFVILCCAGVLGGLGFLLLFWLIPFWIIGFVVMLIRHALAHAYYRVNAIEVTSAQFPEIHATAAAFAQRLGRPLPSIYVIQDSFWNALAMRLVGQPVVVLHSMAVDSILLKGDARQLAFLVGHELGHHYAGHLGWKHFMASLGSWFLWGRLWWSRRCEFTCDRYGLACAGSLEAAQLAICNMAVGAQLASRVNIAEATRQWDTRSGEFFVRYYALYSTHPHTLNRLAVLPAAAAELGVPAQQA